MPVIESLLREYKTRWNEFAESMENGDIYEFVETNRDQMKSRAMVAAFFWDLDESRDYAHMQEFIDAYASKGILIQVNLSGITMPKLNFRGANMRGCKLYMANLKESNMQKVNLSGAITGYCGFAYTDLSGANLQGADLRHASLGSANLQGANLTDADLSMAVMHSANLSGANLRGAELLGVEWSSINFSTDTILPDGSRWNRNTRMSNYTKTEY